MDMLGVTNSQKSTGYLLSTQPQLIAAKSYVKTVALSSANIHILEM
jgi:hypothetical protein